jgi:hypothetical protein
MAKTKRLPEIASLVDDSKCALRIGTLIGLKFRIRTTVRVIVEQNGDSQAIGLKFIVSGKDDAGSVSQTIMFEGAIDLIELPSAMVQTKTIAEALALASDESTLEKVSGNLFAAVIALYGNVSLERYRGDDDYDILLTIRAGKFTATSTLPFAALNAFLKKAPFEEGTGEWMLEEMEKDDERIRTELPESPTTVPPTRQAPYDPCVNCAERLTGVAGRECLGCDKKGPAEDEEG